jgi:hypothetical protein
LYATPVPNTWWPADSVPVTADAVNTFPDIAPVKLVKLNNVCNAVATEAKVSIVDWDTLNACGVPSTVMVAVTDAVEPYPGTDAVMTLKLVRAGNKVPVTINTEEVGPVEDDVTNISPEVSVATAVPVVATGT